VEQIHHTVLIPTNCAINNTYLSLMSLLNISTFTSPRTGIYKDIQIEQILSKMYLELQYNNFI
jgi:hypothetical protein